MGKIHSIPFGLVLTVFFILAVLIFLPYWKAIFLAAVLAIVFWPLFLWINKIIRWRGVASLVTVILVLIIVLIPFSVLGTLVFREASQLYLRVAEGKGMELANTLFLSLQEKFNLLSPYWSGGEDIQGYLTGTLEWIVRNLGAIFSGLARGVIAFIFSLFILFYLFKDSQKLGSFIYNVLPLGKRYLEMVFEKIKLSVRSVVGGSLVVALVQGIVSGVGFAIFGLPNPALWGGVAALAALVPTLGTSLVILPAIVFLYFFNSWTLALGLLIWGAVAVGLIDNLLGPQLMKKGTQMHPLMVLLSVLGGISIFGPIGFILGPVAVGVFFSLLDVYAEMAKDDSTA
ncbi:MAG: hypothetical protein UV58_C0002G0003 [Candidatus Wolfebacteria bacterium GW2011_GWC1_43_10]|uniref:Permease n=2 Tax=Candidatus Wolfeibacteriota TaxID=1752735 RepID=A0A0G1F824_9BACT|nr:MAG: hypothetical protein UV58_C0002G0003 [Candidatus Wolfebacteria bacterium GW2011_GWC1_43_10]KKT23050.1 MAG: hypothetical protein UW08_C0001G0013 [Parcubacteria group bacterium GW2011_GWB1_43_8b]OGM90146.1 MAG: hypothetical protein A2108_02095 [Candidatus Wolfebacteria bacterium GWA1_42_9]